MIQWIALAMAVDAESKASSSQTSSNKALRNINEVKGDPFVIVQPFRLEEVSAVPKNAGFFKKIFSIPKIVLAKKPYGKWSMRRSDLLQLEQKYDEDKKPYVYVSVPPGYEGFYIPGTIEDITKVLNGI